MPDYDLQRFVDAQNGGESFIGALAELRAGRKTSHWVWFVFPQLEGLGRSAMSQRYAISSPAEARAYLAHPILGPRLIACAEALLTHHGCSAREILGEIDAVKLRSSMTLFARAAKPQGTGNIPVSRGLDDFGIFQRVLDRYFEGEADAATEALL